MSHFTVTLRISAARLAAAGQDLEEAVAAMLEPYCEHDDDERSAKYMVFEDKEDELRAEYVTETTTKVKTPTGELFWSWDERFRVPGSIGTGSSTHKTPEDCVEVEVPFTELYKTFEEFCEEYHSYEGRDEKHGRYGTYRNPNATWDWWSIGGRWTGFYPLKSGTPARLGRPGVFGTPAEPGHGDVVYLKEVDMAAVARTMTQRAETFYAEYLQFLEGKKFPPFEGPREKAFSIGLVRVEQGPVHEKKDNEVVLPWDDGSPRWRDDDRRTWNDVATRISKEEFLRKYLDCFHPLATYAALDDEGWHAPGTMGWFGCSSDTPEDKVKWQKDFVGRFLQDHEDLLVLVDCHI